MERKRLSGKTFTINFVIIMIMIQQIHSINVKLEAINGLYTKINYINSALYNIERKVDYNENKNGQNFNKISQDIMTELSRVTFKNDWILRRIDYTVSFVNNSKLEIMYKLNSLNYKLALTLINLERLNNVKTIEQNNTEINKKLDLVLYKLDQKKNNKLDLALKKLEEKKNTEVNDKLDLIIEILNNTELSSRLNSIYELLINIMLINDSSVVYNNSNINYSDSPFVQYTKNSSDYRGKLPNVSFRRSDLYNPYFTEIHKQEYIIIVILCLLTINLIISLSIMCLFFHLKKWLMGLSTETQDEQVRRLR